MGVFFNWLPGLSRLRFTGVALLLALALAWISDRGLLSGFTGWAYDLAVRYGPRLDRSESSVLLVEIPPPGQRVDWAAAVERVEALGARRVVFALVPPPDPRLTSLQDRHHNLLLGRSLRRDPETGAALDLVPWPRFYQDAGIPFAVVQPPPDELGVRRRQFLRVKVAGRSYPTLENAAARSPGSGHADVEDPFMVNFLKGRDRIPIVKLSRLFQDDLVPALVAGRIVVFGYARDVVAPALHTPLTGAGSTMSLLQFQGYAIETLIAGHPIRTLPLAGTLGLFLGLLALCLYLYQILPVRTGGWITVACLPFYALLAVVPLYMLRLWLPVVEMACLQLLSYGMVFARRAMQEEQVILHALHEMSARLRNRTIPAGIYATDEPWIYIANLLNQTLELRRQIFLEKVEGDHRVREVYALNCSLDDIHEKRRDYHRTPYSSAIAANAPIRLERTYLREEQEQEQQYLVPLSFAGEIIGFWAFGVMPGKVTDQSNFITLIRDFAEQIAEMLYHRRRWLEEQRQASNPVGRYLGLEGWDDTCRALNQSLALLERRLLGLERVFDGMGTAAILYDLFGRVLHVNQQMEQLMKRVDVPFFRLTAIDLICRVTEREPEVVRQYLHFVILERNVISLPTPLLNDPERTYLLTLRPMFHQMPELGTVEEPVLPDEDGVPPLQMGGVLIECQDISMFRSLSDLQSSLVRRLEMELRNDLEAILLAVELMVEEDAGGPDTGWVIASMQQKVDAAVATFQKVQKYLHFSLGAEVLEYYPVDLLEVLAAGLREVGEEAEKRQTEIRQDLPRLLPLVMASPQALAEVLAAMLRVLIRDTREGGHVDIRIRSSELWVELELSNDGYGLPQERLQEYLHGDLDVSIDEFRGIRSALRRIEAWQGQFEARSGVGQGMLFRIRLKGFI